MEYKSFNGLHLIRQFSGDEEILLDMISIFHHKLPELLAALRESIEYKDADKLRLNAHTIKGVLSNFFAEPVRELAYELELRGKEANFDDSLILLNRLENQLMVFIYELRSLKKDLNQI